MSLRSIQTSWEHIAIVGGVLLFTIIGTSFFKTPANRTRPGTPQVHSSGSMRLRNVSIADLSAGLQSGQFTSVELVKTYIARIEQINAQLHPISQLNPDAISIARERDEERRRGHIRGVLHGVPILVKDLFATVDKMDNTVGSTGLVGAKPAAEATVIKKLRESGAILLGKTVPSQWANYRSPGQAPGGWSAYGGLCKGAFHEDQYASGSSSGSAVAMSLGLAAVALATETSGSISNPASRAAVVGLKPSVGLASRYGVYCVSEWQDSVGVIAQTVKDAASTLTVIFGTDKNDKYTYADPRDEHGLQRPPEGTDFSDSCTIEGLRGVRIAVPRHVISSDSFVVKKFDEALHVLKNLGATIVDNAHYSEWTPDYSKTDKEKWKLAFRIDLRDNMQHFLGSFSHNPNRLHTLADLIEYTKQTPKEQSEEYGMKEWLAAEKAASNVDKTSEAYADSLRRRNRMGGQIPELLDRYDCDLLIVPEATETTSNVGGCPSIVVPLGLYPSDWTVKRNAHGLVSKGPNIPFGLQFVARRNDDARLIAAAYAYEQATNIRANVQPVHEPTVELDADTAGSPKI